MIVDSCEAGVAGDGGDCNGTQGGRDCGPLLAADGLMGGVEGGTKGGMKGIDTEKINKIIN